MPHKKMVCLFNCSNWGILGLGLPVMENRGKEWRECLGNLFGRKLFSQFLLMHTFKRIGHLKSKIVVIYSPSCHSKPVVFYILKNLKMFFIFFYIFI